MTQLTPFKTIWPDFCIVYQIDSFQDNMTWLLYCVPNWLLSRPSYLILSMCTQLTPFNTIWMEFYIVYPLYPIDSFQDHVTRFLHSILNWLLSRQYDLIFVLCTQLTHFKTIWPNFINVLCAYFYQCVTNWLFSIPYDLIFALFTQMTTLKTIWPNFIIVYPIDSFQDHLTWFLHSTPNWLLSRSYDLIFVLFT